MTVSVFHRIYCVILKTSFRCLKQIDPLLISINFKNTRLTTVENYPPALMCWPDIVLGMFKSRAFRDHNPVGPDLRSTIYQYLTNASADRTDLYFRPVMYAISELLYEDDVTFFFFF